MNFINFAKIIIVAYFCISTSKANSGPPCSGKYHLDDLRRDLREKIKIETRSYTKLVHKNFDLLPENIQILNMEDTINVELNYEDNSKRPTISGGPLKGKGTYVLHEIFFNWLEYYPKDFKFGDVYLSAELHIYFYKTELKDIVNALDYNEGVAIMSFRLEKPYPRNDTSNEGLSIIANNLKSVREPRTTIDLENSQLFTLNDLLPSETVQFEYTYIGTMIGNHNCYKNVIWMDYKEKLQITEEEIYEFQELKTPYGLHMYAITHEYSRLRSVVYTNSGGRLFSVVTVSELGLVILSVVFRIFY